MTARRAEHPFCPEPSPNHATHTTTHTTAHAAAATHRAAHGAAHANAYATNHADATTTMETATSRENAMHARRFVSDGPCSIWVPAAIVVPEPG